MSAIAHDLAWAWARCFHVAETSTGVVTRVWALLAISGRTWTLADVHYLETMPGEMAARIVALSLLCFFSPNPGLTAFQAYSVQLLDD